MNTESSVSLSEHLLTVINKASGKNRDDNLKLAQMVCNEIFSKKAEGIILSTKDLKPIVNDELLLEKLADYLSKEGYVYIHGNELSYYLIVRIHNFISLSEHKIKEHMKGKAETANNNSENNNKGDISDQNKSTNTETFGGDLEFWIDNRGSYILDKLISFEELPLILKYTQHRYVYPIAGSNNTVLVLEAKVKLTDDGYQSSDTVELFFLTVKYDPHTNQVFPP